MEIVKDLAIAEFSETLFLTHTNDDQRFFHELNPTASIVWKAVTERLTEDQIVQRITSEFEVSESIARKDIKNIMTQFQQLGLFKI